MNKTVNMQKIPYQNENFIVATNGLEATIKTYDVAQVAVIEGGIIALTIFIIIKLLVQAIVTKSTTVFKKIAIALIFGFLSAYIIHHAIPKEIKSIKDKTSIVKQKIIQN